MLLSGRFLGKSQRTRDRVAETGEVFVQPSRGLLADALGRPLGLVALGAMVLGGVALVLTWNDSAQSWPTDYALMILFVAAAAFVVVVLRAGDARPLQPLRVIDDTEPAEAGEVVLTNRRPSRRSSSARATAPPAPKPSVGLDGDGSSFESYRRALLHFQKSNDLRGQGEVLRRLGHLAKTKRRLQDSRDLYISARSCFRDVGDNYAEAAVLLDLGQVLESMGEQDMAGAAYREANRLLLDVAMESGDSTDGRRQRPMLDHAAD